MMTEIGLAEIDVRNLEHFVSRLALADYWSGCAKARAFEGDWADARMALERASQVIDTLKVFTEYADLAVANLMAPAASSRAGRTG